MRVFVIEVFEVSGESVEVGLILLSDFSEGDAGGSLLMNECSESCLSLDEGVWDSLLSAECGDVENELDGINIVSNNDEFGCTILNESCDMVKSEFNGERLGSNLFILLSLDLVGSFSLESSCLLFMSLWLVLTEELEKLLGLVSLEGMGELGDLWGDLKSGHKNSLLSLHLNILGPLDESGKVLLVHDISADSV